VLGIADLNNCCCCHGKRDQEKEVLVLEKEKGTKIGSKFCRS
jgi:hypothetical protein